ncbi:MAG: PadR family transcriptional regulator [Thermoanaerobaculia bacterium]
MRTDKERAARVERELMRGAGPAAVLALLDRQGEMYGYELVEALSSGSGGALDMGQATLYPMLYNLEAKGLLHGTWREAENGRRRKYYALTGKGKRRLAAHRSQWRAVARAMTSLGVLERAAR